MKPGEYIGAAPKAYLLIVKTEKYASRNLIDRYLVTNDLPQLYESTDYMLGMKDIFLMRRKNSICRLLCVSEWGTNDGAHDAAHVDRGYISSYPSEWWYALLYSVGNEANAKTPYRKGKYLQQEPQTENQHKGGGSRGIVYSHYSQPRI
jgi:hypothetical protein